MVVTGTTNDFTTEEAAHRAEAGVDGAIVVQIDGGDGRSAPRPRSARSAASSSAPWSPTSPRITGAPREDIAVDAVGPRWGQQITRQSLRALLVFLVLVSLYLSIRFEWRMAAAIVTLLHDIALSVGIYAIVGFPVTPASVIAFLTILGFSLYDTVIVFDRVSEDTAKLTSVSTKTYGQTANEALNEVLVRSLSTSVTALLPVGSLLFVGAQLLGAETLKDLALALFIGMAVGTYSSVVIATPFLVWLKEKEPRWAELKERVSSRRVPGPEPALASGTCGGDGPQRPATVKQSARGLKKASKPRPKRRR